MKKLSDFTGREATNLIGDLLLHICKIIQNKKNLDALNKNGFMGLLGEALKNTPKEVIGILAALNEKKPEEYEYSAATLMADTYKLFEDPEIIQLFGLQS